MTQLKFFIALLFFSLSAQAQIVSCPGEGRMTLTIPAMTFCNTGTEAAEDLWVDHAAGYVPENTWTCSPPCEIPYEQCLRTLQFDCSSAPTPIYWAGCLYFPAKDIRVKITCYCLIYDPDNIRLGELNEDDIRIINSEKHGLENFQIQSNLFPNPAITSTTLSLQINSDLTDVKISIYNIEGKQVESIATQSLLSGINTFTLNTSSFSTGTYMVQVRWNNIILANTQLQIH